MRHVVRGLKLRSSGEERGENDENDRNEEGLGGSPFHRSSRALT